MEEFAPGFEPLPISEEDRKLVAPFFTNIDKSVFAVTFLPAEVIGALCSMASRAKEDLRIVFLEQYTKAFLKDENEYSKSLKALIDFLHEHPAEVVFANPKAREFYIKWLAQFGDDSIAQMSGAHLIFSGISQIAIALMEEQRVGLAPIEKSTRYVDYSSKVNGKYRYYTDPTLATYGLKEEYEKAMDNLFETYTALLQEYGEFLKKKYPAEEERVIKTKAFDTVRGLLPMATLSQVAFFGNGQAFEYYVNRSLDHNLGEIRWTAQSTIQELGRVIPAFLRRVEEDGAKKYREYKINIQKRITDVLPGLGWQENKEANTIKAPYVKLLEFDAQGEDKIIAGLIYPSSYESFDSVLGKVGQMNNDQKEQVVKAAMQGRLYKYYKSPRAFENAFLRFEVCMNIGAWRDLRRHRMHTQYRQLFNVYNGFDVPEGLVEAGLDKKFSEAIKQAEEIFKKIEKVNPELAQYATVMAHRVKFIQYQNVRAFFWETELRTINQGHPDYRKIEQDKVRIFQKIYPLLAKYLLADMADYDFARRGDSAAIQRKEEELKKFFGA